MKSSDLLSRPVELEVILWVLGNDIFPNGRLRAGFKLLVSVTVEQRSCQHKHNPAEQKKNTFVGYLASVSVYVWSYTLAVEQVDSMSGLQFGVDRRLM